VQDTTQFDSKLTVLSDALHQGIDEIAQGSELRLIQIDVALVFQIHLHGRLTAGSCFNYRDSATEVLTDLLQQFITLLDGAMVLWRLAVRAQQPMEKPATASHNLLTPVGLLPALYIERTDRNSPLQRLAGSERFRTAPRIRPVPPC
jgi:hypothetical protein